MQNNDNEKKAIKLLACSSSRLKFEEGEKKGKLRNLNFRTPKSFIHYPSSGFSIGTVFCKHENEAIYIATLIKEKNSSENKTKKSRRKKKVKLKSIDEILGNPEELDLERDIRRLPDDNLENDDDIDIEETENKVNDFSDLFF